MTTAAPDLTAPPDDAAVERAIALFAGRLRRRYGGALRGLYLFGSRARGDAHPFSDVDIAVVLDDARPAGAETRPLAEIAYDLLLETGAEIQPWAFAASAWEHPERSAERRLLGTVRRDARPVGPP